MSAGEFARAVLQEQSVYSRPRWYSVTSTEDVNFQPGNEISLLINIEENTEFLLTSFSLKYRERIGANIQVLTNPWNATISLVQLRANIGASRVAPNAANVQSYLSAPFENPSYMRLQGDETLKINITLLAQPFGLGNSVFSFTAAGIEYLKK